MVLFDDLLDLGPDFFVIAGVVSQPFLEETTCSFIFLALCCKRLFGLELFGLDCIRTPSGTVVIEVNDFPNYGSVPSASERLADFVMKRARATRRRT